MGQPIDKPLAKGDSHISDAARRCLGQIVCCLFTRRFEWEHKMAKFILLYNGPATDPADMAEEQRNEVMAAWGSWMGNVGEALVDMGAPMGAGVAVVDDGSESVSLQLNGYSILEAADLDTAKELVTGHPFLSDSDGLFRVEILELLPVPSM